MKVEFYYKGAIVDMVWNNVLIMKIGKNANGFEITKEMLEKSINTFPNTSVVFNENQIRKDYTNEVEVDIFNKQHIIGLVGWDAKIEDDGAYASIIIADWFINKWNRKLDNWQVQVAEDGKSFKLCCVEVF